MRHVSLLLAAAAMLAACQPRNDAGAPASEPATAPEPVVATPAPAVGTPGPAPGPALLDPAFAVDLDARGTEPFWAVEIRAGTLTLKRPDQADVTVEHAGATSVNGAAAWASGSGAAGMKVTLRKAACSDGMSDRAYPMTAEVSLGAETLKGCAAPA
jgi:uncharacterized membrane protein